MNQPSAKAPSPAFGVAVFSTGVAMLALLAATPLLSRAREALPLLVASSVALTALALRRPLRPAQRWTLLLACVAAAAVTAAADARRVAHRRVVLNASPAAIERASRHMLIGYRDRDQLLALLGRFDFAGVFVTARNVKGRSLGQVAADLAELQALQARLGRAPLLIATDQEGGGVSRLSGPLPWRASVATAGGEEEARDVGALTGAELAALGVNVNFAPVVDLQLARPGPFDRNSRIAERAIAGSPERVAALAGAYIEGMASAGVLPVAKHFPGLGRLSRDTHVSDAWLDTDAGTLRGADWLPFARLAQGGDSAVMVGHAIATALDARHPASLSAELVTERLRGELGHAGLVFTDDLCMAPVFRRGPAESVRAALGAGVDVVLVTYDPAVVFEVLASVAGDAPFVETAASDARLARARSALAARPHEDGATALRLERRHVGVAERGE